MGAASCLGDQAGRSSQSVLKSGLMDNGLLDTWATAFVQQSNNPTISLKLSGQMRKNWQNIKKQQNEESRPGFCAGGLCAEPGFGLARGAFVARSAVPSGE